MWALEPHYDGPRVLAIAAGGSVRVVRQNEKMRAERASARERLEGSAVESVATRARQALERLAAKHDGGFVLDGYLVGESTMQFVIVDLLAERGTPLVDEPWLERRTRLEALLPASRPASPLLASEYVISDGAGARDEARNRGWTRAVAKRIDAPYESGPSNMWKML